MPVRTSIISNLKRASPLIISGLATLVLAPSAVADEKIGIAMPTNAGAFYSAVLYGAMNEAERLGYDVVVLDAGGFAHPETQIDHISNLVVQGVDAILTDPIDPATLNGAMRQARAAGIAVVGLGSPVVATDVEADAASTSSQCDLGKQMAKGARSVLPEGGTIVSLAGPPGAYWANERYRCFKEGIEGTDIKIISERYSAGDAATALSITNDFLQRFPDADLIYAADDTLGVGAARAVQQVGQCGTVKVLMAGYGEAAEEMLNVGCAQYIVAQQTVLIGRTAVRLADALIKGATLDQKITQVPFLSVTAETASSVDVSLIRQPADWKP